MKLKIYLLILLALILTCAMIHCTREYSLIARQVLVKNEIYCSTLFEESKERLLEGKDQLIFNEYQRLEDIHFEFPTKYTCLTEDAVIFDFSINLNYFDTDSNVFICITASNGILAFRNGDQIELKFENWVIQSLDAC